MSAGTAAFLVGLYVIPAVLVWWSLRLRRQSARARRAFWGAVAGHCLAGVLALVAGMSLPEEWTAAERLRGAAGFWALFLLPVVGAVVGATAWAGTPGRAR